MGWLYQVWFGWQSYLPVNLIKQIHNKIQGGAQKTGPEQKCTEEKQVYGTQGNRDLESV